MEEQFAEPIFLNPIKPISMGLSGSSEFRVIREIIPFNEALAKRQAGFRDQKCVLCRHTSTGNIRFLASQGPEETDIDRAALLNVRHLIENRMSYSRDWSFAILDQDQLAREPARRKFQIATTLNSTLIELMKIVPGNPTVRAHLLAVFGVEVPKEMETYDQIKDWLEFNCDPPAWNDRNNNYSFNSDDAHRRPTANQAAQVVAHIRMIEEGTCRYRVARRFNITFPMPEGLIRDIVAGNRSISGMMRQLQIQVEQFARDNDSGEGYQDYEYDDYSCDDTSERSCSIQTDTRTVLMNYIRSNYGTQEAEEIISR